MRRILIYIIFIVVCCPVSALTYYVSSSEGCNANDGLSMQSPKKDLSEVPKRGVIILLKCGDVFWGGIHDYIDCAISSYGKGDRPVICGFKVLKDPQAWKSIGKDLWSIDLMDSEVFTGNVEIKYYSFFNNIGFIYDANRDKVYGRNLENVEALKFDMDFFTSAYTLKEDIEKYPIREIVVKSKNNPSIYGNLCFPMYQSGMSLMTNCTIRGIAIVGFSYMGMYNLYKCRVEDCQIDLIGGGLQIGNSKRARLGNGIELWYDCNDNTITDCLISRTYDCATTIQASGVIKSTPRNNHFINNRIYKCRQAFEHFMNPSDGELVAYDNCEFSRNICYLMGDNEFDSPELRDCNILSYEESPKPIEIKNNVFFGANHLDGGGVDAGMSRNTIYLFQDQYLYMRHWDKDRTTIIGEDEYAAEKYNEQTKDDSKIVVLKRGSLKAKRINRRIKRCVNWNPVNLHLKRILN